CSHAPLTTTHHPHSRGASAVPTSRTYAIPPQRRLVRPRNATFWKPGPRPESPPPRTAKATRTPAQSLASRCTPPPPPSASIFLLAYTGGHAREEVTVQMDSRFCSSRIDVLVFAGLRAVAQIVHEQAN